MNSVIFDPLSEFKDKLKPLHDENTAAFFENLVKQSGVNPDQNRETVRLYHKYKEDLEKMRKKLNWLRFFRVLMCITIILIPLVIWKMTPKIKALRAEIEAADKKADELLRQAYEQMAPLNALFTDHDALDLIEKTIPLMDFDRFFTVKQEEDMRINYDFDTVSSAEQSTVDVLAGRYNENPFLFENKLIHSMGVHTYYGYKTIYWTETYRDSNGNLRSRTRSQTLQASVTKPKPYYSNQIVLNYCAQGAPDLSFSRDAGHLDQKSDREIEKMVKRGEKKLNKMNDKAVRNNSEFTSLSNTEFEVLFDALNRDNEVQYRTLFTPLAQTNLVSLIRSKDGFGDDFHFFKSKRTNRVTTEHSQGRVINLLPKDYTSYSFDVIRESFLGKNTAFFKALYFDFAPVLAIPIYQERPVHSLKPIPDYSQYYSLKESEVLANSVDPALVVHPDTKTQAILKSSFVRSSDQVDVTCITAFSYDIEKRLDLVRVLGGDGHFHNVPVEWDEYLPLENSNHFCISTDEKAGNKTVFARHNGLCIYNS